MNLDELFEILDCYVEQSYFTYEPNKIWTSTYGNECSAKIDLAIYKVECSNGKANTITDFGSLQLTTSH